MPIALEFDIDTLLPQTHYWIAVTALDSCLNASPPVIMEVITPALPNGEVSWCFVATAAHGSAMAPAVSALRSLRDRVLKQHAVGAMLVDAYYTGEDEAGFAWNDPEAAIPWPVTDPVLSDRDRGADGLDALIASGGFELD